MTEAVLYSLDQYSTISIILTTGWRRLHCNPLINTISIIHKTGWRRLHCNPLINTISIIHKTGWRRLYCTLLINTVQSPISAVFPSSCQLNKTLYESGVDNKTFLTPSDSDNGSYIFLPGTDNLSRLLSDRSTSRARDRAHNVMKPGPYGEGGGIRGNRTSLRTIKCLSALINSTPRVRDWGDVLFLACGVIRISIGVL